ncbi:MAG: hypothetical protein EXR67_04470 [Dehalococcoidia bacterium]|nr:hypothetical protein [Dehalococcoidia bacterium]
MWLFGRSKAKDAPSKIKPDKLSTLATVSNILEEQFHMRPIGKLGLCLRPHSGAKKDTSPKLTEPDLEAFANNALGIGAVTSGTEFKATQDQYKYLWLVLRNDDLPDLLSAGSKIITAIKEKGHDANLVAAVIPFRSEDGKEVNWIYELDRDRFYPFVPQTEPRRDNQLEVELATKTEKDLPVEQQLERWRAVWGAPLDVI